MSKGKDKIDFDVIIIGAGLSGINFAYRLQERNPELKYCILEGRRELGGTWSLFQYPGIRSDSDLFTFGFPWRPWTGKQTIAKGSQILNYLKDSARQEKIDSHIKLRHQVNTVHWSSVSRTWTVSVTTNGAKEANKTLRAGFVFFGTGYYDYDEPLKVDIPGLQNFKGTIVHPQFWPSDLDYSNKDIVVIGSGATAVTILPSVALKAAHVTMLQRSPSYIMPLPAEGTFEAVFRKVLPQRTANTLIRFKWILTSFLLVSFCRNFPKVARKVFLHTVARQLPPGTNLTPNFIPSYSPWEQRVCMCPNGDFYKALHNDNVEVKTGTIDAITRSSIHLATGEELHADIIITATGLKLRMGGGINIYVDGESYEISKHYVWNSSMLEDLPNAVFAWGYVDASWTLGADATAQLACRLLSRMKQGRTTALIPKMSPELKSEIKDLPFLSLQATYIQKGKDACPKAGNQAPWLPRSYYWKDILMAWWGNIEDGTEWIK